MKLPFFLQVQEIGCSQDVATMNSDVNHKENSESTKDLGKIGGAFSEPLKYDSPGVLLFSPSEGKKVLTILI